MIKNEKREHQTLFCLMLTIGIMILFIFTEYVQSEDGQGEQQLIKLNLMNQIKQSVTTEAGSFIVDLEPEAIKLGLSEVQLYGEIKQKELPDKTTRMHIKWHSIGVPTTGSNLIDTLEFPLESQFRTKDARIEPGEVISAKGDLQGLIDKFLELKERAKNEEPKHVLEKTVKEETAADTETESEEFGSGGSTPSAGGSSGVSPLEDQASSDKESFQTINEWESCEPKVITDEGVVFRQHRKIEKDEYGSVVNIGACENNGDPIKIQKEYGSCPVIFDMNNHVAYVQYQEYADVDGERIQVTNCTNDYSKTYQIYSKKSDCETRIDIDSGKSYPQEKLYYSDDTGTEHQVRDCQDSNKAYSLFMTDLTCDNEINKAANTVTVYKRSAYYLDDGTIEYADTCKAVEQVAIQRVYDENCPSIYDYQAKKVYEQYREIAIIDGQEIEITSCTKDPGRTYDMYSKESDCQPRTDINTGKTYAQERLYYKDSNGIEHELTGCQDSDKSFDITMTSITCTNDIDLVNKTVTVFKRPSYTLGDGTVQYVGECIAVEQVAIQRVYDEKSPIIYDYQAKKVYEQYREFTIIDGQELEITPPTKDPERTYGMFGIKSDCGNRYDPDLGKSVVQEKLYYKDYQGIEIKLTDCQDSDKIYNIFMTTITCDNNIDHTNKLVTAYKRPAFYLDNGTIEYASACQAVEQAEIKRVYDSNCPNIFDFQAGKVYGQYREIAIIDGQEMEITGCTKDLDRTYDIYSKESGCTPRADMNDGKTYFQEKLYYQDSKGVEHEITGCQDSDKSFDITMTPITCTNDIDLVTKTVTVFKRPSYTLGDGTVQYVGECQAVEQVAIQRVYDEKSPTIYNYANKEVYDQYREFAIIDGQEIEITPPTKDPNRTYDMYGLKSNCGNRYDSDLGKTFVQEKLYYKDYQGIEHELTDCQDSEKVYDIFMTGITCNNDIDDDTKTVIIYKRPAYNLDNGTMVYAGNCQAVEQAPIQKVYDDKCAIIYDFEAGKVFDQYREFAIIDGKEYETKSCSSDLARTYDMYGKPSECPIRHDVNEAKSFVQESIYFTGADGVETKIKDCQDTDVYYDHFLTEETCEIEIDNDNGRVTQYKRIGYKKPDGTTVYVNDCQPIAVFDIEREYGSPCPVIYDIKNEKVYEQYREFVTLSDEVRELQGCTNDFTLYYEMYTKPSDCGIRDDFNVSKSYPQEKLYYTGSDSLEVLVSPCQDAKNGYSHFLTDLSCNPLIDLENGKVTTYKRIAYRLPNGDIEFASECRAVDDGSYQILEAFCDPKYEHNYVTGQSYYRTRDYYVKDGSPIYLSNCLISTSQSFSHKLTIDGCGLTHDDANLRSTQRVSTVVDTPDGEIELIPCQDNGVTISYAYIGIENKVIEFTSSGSWTVPDFVKTITVTVVAGGSDGGSSYKNSDKMTGGSGGGAHGGGGSESYSWSGRVSISGAGGAGGEIITKTLTVTPGQEIPIVIGARNQNTTFASNVIIARTGYGAYGGGSRIIYDRESDVPATGGSGGIGYGTIKLSTDGQQSSGGETSPYANIGKGGVGYGGGGGGAPGAMPRFKLFNGGLGAPGYIKITYPVNVYKRSDNTEFRGQTM